MKKIIIAMASLVIWSCNSHPEDCLPKEGVALMLRNKFDYSEVLRRNYIQIEEVRTLLDVGKLINELAGNLINAAGGVDQEGSLVNPCIKGELIIDAYSRSNFIENLRLEIHKSTKKESFDWKSVPGIRRVVDDNLDKDFMNQLIQNRSLGYLVLKLMLIENKIYAQIMSAKAPCE